MLRLLPYVAILPVADAHDDYAREVEGLLKEQGIRTEYLNPSESLGKRIREGEKSKIPFLLVLGDTEAKERSVAARSTVTKEQVSVSLEEFIEKTVEDVRERRLEASIG